MFTFSRSPRRLVSVVAPGSPGRDVSDFAGVPLPFFAARIASLYARREVSLPPSQEAFGAGGPLDTPPEIPAPSSPADKGLRLSCAPSSLAAFPPSCSPLCPAPSTILPPSGPLALLSVPPSIALSLRHKTDKVPRVAGSALVDPPTPLRATRSPSLAHLGRKIRRRRRVAIPSSPAPSSSRGSFGTPAPTAAPAPRKLDFTLPPARAEHRPPHRHRQPTLPTPNPRRPGASVLPFFLPTTCRTPSVLQIHSPPALASNTRDLPDRGLAY